MREGFNPNKDKVILKNDFYHQVIIPVYIPCQEGYFRDSLKILRYCLESLIRTSHTQTYFTIVNNGSCIEVIQYLNGLYQDKKIHELIHTDNIGKLNAILKGVVGQHFQLVTICDSDVLFLNDWQKATYQVFEAFPKTGVVCPTPSSKSFNDKTYNILFEKLFSKKLFFTKVSNPQAFLAFAHSIGNPFFYKNTHLENYLVVSSGAAKAVVGAGHFVGTYRFDIFKTIEFTYSEFALGGDSENRILDTPVIENGLWRLSTENNYAYHMGNVLEVWMDDVFDSLENNSEKLSFELKTSIGIENKMLFWIKNNLLAKLLYQKKIRHWFLQYKGLPKKDINEY
jgi:hypothetical protein